MADITKIYEIQLTGEDELLNKMRQVNNTFDQTKKKFQETKQAISKGLLNKAELEAARQALVNESAAMVRQQAEAKRLAAEHQALKNAKQQLTIAEMQNQAAARETYSEYQKLSRELNTAKMEAKGLGATFGVESAQFKTAAANVQVLDSKLKAIDASLGEHRRNVGNYASGFDALGNSVAQLTREAPAFAHSLTTGFMAISNNLPIFADAMQQAIEKNRMLQAEGKPTTSILKQLAGAIFGWQTLLSIGIVLLTVYGKQMVEWIQKNVLGKKAVDELAESQKHLTDALKEADYKKAVRDISEMTNTIKLAREGVISKDKALKFYNETLGKVMGSAQSLDQVEQIMVKNADNYIKATLYKAAANRALDKSAEEMLKAEEARQKKAQEFKNIIRDTYLGGGTMGMGGGAFDPAEYERQKARQLAAQKKAQQEEIKLAENAAKAQENIAKKMMAEAAKYAKGLNFDATLGLSEAKPKNKREMPSRGSRLSGEQRDYLRDLEAQRDEELAVIERSYRKGEILEDEFIKRSLASNVRYYDAKIAYLKKGNAEERKQEARALLDKENTQREANDKLYNIYKKQFDDELKLAEKASKNKLENTLNDPYSDETAKLDAQRIYHEESTAAQLDYNNKMMNLETELSKNMVEEANERAELIKQKTDQQRRNEVRDLIARTKEYLRIAEEAQDYLQNENEINSAIEERNILQDKSLTIEQQKAALERVAGELRLKNINAELGKLDSQIFLLQLAKTERKLTNEEEKKLNDLLKDREKILTSKAFQENDNKQKGWVSAGSVGSGTSGIASTISKSIAGKDGKISLGTDKAGNNIDGTDMIGNVIAQSFDLATQAMNNYFESEKQRIEQSRQLAYQRIDLEREQSKRYAQSNAEREAIDKEAAAKKKRADKQAGEQLKKQKKNEAKIAFLMELANIWSSVWSMGNPIVAGIMGGVLSALAVARYATTVSSINQMKYAKGGKYFSFGGKLSGPSHSDNGGMPVVNPYTGDAQAYMEGGEGIINKRSMSSNRVVSVTGTPNQIASRINALGGGVDWAGGATLKYFAKGGTYMGSQVQPPVFGSYFTQPSGIGNQADFTEVKQMISDLALITSAESSKKVVVSNKEIFSKKENYDKQTQIATL